MLPYTFSIFTVFSFFFLSLVVPIRIQAESGSTQLLTKPWRFTARKDAAERYQLIDPNVLKGATHLRLTYNLKGACILSGDASAIVFDQQVKNSWWRYVSLFKYGKNCYYGQQTIDIPLSHFPNLDRNKPVGTFHARIWNRKPYDIEITSAILHDPNEAAQKIGVASFGLLLNSLATSILPSSTPISPSSMPTRIPTETLVSTKIPIPFPTPTILPSKIPLPYQENRASWSIQSVSSMKETKDRICNPRPAEFINRWVQKASELGANYVAIETPYENSSCGDARSYTRSWVEAARSLGLRVWHRHMPLAFEGIYNVKKNSSLDYLNLIADYIKANPTFFREGDIFTPIPEPQNGGIRGVTHCAQGVCVFRSQAHFNIWLRDAIDVSEQAFASIELGGKIKIGYYGFDGFVAWGDNNPNWDGVLEDATVIKMGNITIDHYPEIVGDTMENDLNELERRYPNIPIIIGEWGTISGGNMEQQVVTSMKAAQRPSVVGFNYWHMGVGGREELIREDFSEKSQFDEVQSFYKNAK